MEITVLEFLKKDHNFLLAATAAVSGAMLLWPLARRAGGGPRVGAAEATMLINREDALLVDVREPGEYSAGHALGAKNVPLARIDDGGSDLAKRKERPLVVYCDSGERSAKAAATLRKQGFARVTTLSGGLGAWQQAGMPVEK